MISYPNAKVNLALNILRRRPDGFHDLQSVFLPYKGLTDILEINPSDTFSVNIEGCTWDPMSDLTVKAWKLMSDKYGIAPVSIRMVKRIPVGAGLGGGSSDAAFALQMMNEMFSLGLPDAALAADAATLGSDCAFFIFNRPMLAEGRGEILSDIEVNLDGYVLKVVSPEGISVSTKEAYSGVRPREACGREIPDLRAALKQPVNMWKDLLVNDFEESVFAVHPTLASIGPRLYEEGAVYASMSGSGSSFFGIFRK